MPSLGIALKTEVNQSRKVLVNSEEYEHEEFYRLLVSRNLHFISAMTQKKMRQLKILIAGCGSTGGSCIETLARAGVENFILADNGEYEITNLNRQHARCSSIGLNKAVFHQKELLEINPFIRVVVDSNGITEKNSERFCEMADLIFDAVDVTTESGMAAKLQLHVAAKKFQRPVLSALDLGFHQFGMSFDYRRADLELLAGNWQAAKDCQHPIKALFSIYPLSAVPDHCLRLITDLAQGTCSYASQLGCTSDLLGALIVPIVIRFLQSGELVKGWSYDSSSIVEGKNWNIQKRWQSRNERLELSRILKRLK